MRSPVSWILTLSLVGLCTTLGLGQETGVSGEHHPWGSFEVGAWKRVRVVSETFEGDEAVTTTITETKTTLEKIEDDGVTLRIEVAVELGRERFESDPQIVRQGWHGEMLGQNIETSRLGEGEVKVQGRFGRQYSVPCKIEQVVVNGPSGKTTTKIFFSDMFEPHVFKRESVKTSADGNTVLAESTVEVLAVNVPCKVLSGIGSASHLKATCKYPKKRTTTTAMTSARIPGGVICHTSKEFDDNGRLIRGSSLELIGYGLQVADERNALGQRKRAGRSRPPVLATPHRFHLPNDRP